MEKPWITIGDVATRAGVAASTLRFYETEGLISGRRSAGGHRQYARDTLRRIAFIRAAQAVGISGQRWQRCPTAARQPKPTGRASPGIGGHGLMPRSPHCNGCVSNWTVASAAVACR